MVAALQCQLSAAARATEVGADFGVDQVDAQYFQQHVYYWIEQRTEQVFDQGINDARYLVEYAGDDHQYCAKTAVTDGFVGFQMYARQGVAEAADDVVVGCLRFQEERSLADVGRRAGGRLEDQRAL